MNKFADTGYPALIYSLVDFLKDDKRHKKYGLQHNLSLILPDDIKNYYFDNNQERLSSVAMLLNLSPEFTLQRCLWQCK